MKKTKIIIPALGMLLLSTAASVTGTVAWFSMNNFVNATNMNIRAKAENGIVISTAANSNTWTEEADHAIATPLAVYPTSTLNGSTWAHSASNDADSATSNGSYTMIHLDPNYAYDSTKAAGYLNKNGDEGYQTTAGTTTGYTDKYDEAYYLMQSFYIKSSAEEMQKTIYITKVLVTGSSNAGSPNLDKSLRVLVKHSSEARVFAPFYQEYEDQENGNQLVNTLQYQVCTSLTGTTANKEQCVAYRSGTDGVVNNSFLSNQKIPAYAYSANAENPLDPLKIDIYVYFEGEDENCKSTNLTESLSNLKVEVEFGTAER